MRRVFQPWITGVVLVLACKSKSPPPRPVEIRDAVAPSFFPTSATAASTPRWQFDAVVVEAAAPRGMKLARVSSMGSVRFASDVDHTSWLELDEAGSTDDRAGVAARIARWIDDARRPGATVDKPLVEHRPGTWVSRLRYEKRIDVFVAHVIPNTGLYLACHGQLTAPASDSVDEYERFCVQLRWRDEVTDRSIDADIRGAYPFEDRDVKIIPPAGWKFLGYHRWPEPEVAFQVDATAAQPHPSGIRMRLRIASWPNSAASLAELVTSQGRSSLAEHFRWLEEPREVAASVWGYRTVGRARPEFPEALNLAIASIEGRDPSRVMWCFVTIFRPEDHALADELERYCREVVAL